MLTNEIFDNQELNASLLSIRAGLSAISKIADKINEENKKVENVQKELKKTEKEISETHKAIDSNSQKIANLKNWNKELNLEKEREETTYKKSGNFFHIISQNTDLKITFYGSFILSVIILLLNLPDLQSSYMVFLFPTSLVFLISLVCGIVSTLKNKKRSQKITENLI